jgi:hypothetical protein
MSRRNLKNRIEKVENTLIEVQTSPLYVASVTAPKHDVIQYRSQSGQAMERDIFGRNSLIESIIGEFMRADERSSSQCYSVIGIYGVAGSGKSILVRCIGNHIKKYGRAVFDAIMCIHVSKTFSLDDIFHDMLEDITNDRHSNISDFGELKSKLKQQLAGKRFLLILDNIWAKDNNFQELKKILSAINVGLQGSRVMLTARDKHTATALGAHEPTAMPCMSDDDRLEMFMHYAGHTARKWSLDFEHVGRQIFKKLDRSPIAVVAVAARLLGQPKHFWIATAELDMLNQTSGALWWCYLQLNVDIRRCFQYCNIFPRRFKLKRDELVRLWIAQGLVKTTEATKDIELEAKRYFQELVSSSFLQLEGTSADTNYFTIPNQLREIAEKVSGNDFFRIENARSDRGGSSLLRKERGEDWKHVRHLFLKNYDEKWISEILELKNLRTLIVYKVGHHVPVEYKVMNSIFSCVARITQSPRPASCKQC